METRVIPGNKVDLAAWPTDGCDAFASKEAAQKALAESIERMAELQYKLYATNARSVLIVMQGMDAAGKDSLIRHVMTGLNPQGLAVTSFKTPTAEELDHDFLWRYHRATPRRGTIGLFNRSHYEDVLITRVHPEMVVNARPPGVSRVEDLDEGFWKRRLKSIAAFEQQLVDGGTVICKFYLHLSKAEQKQRFLERIDEAEKNWKFSTSDVEERAYWDEYKHAYEQAIEATSTEAAPWHVVPADRKWATRAIVAQIVVAALEGLDLRIPPLTPEASDRLESARRSLTSE